MDAEVVTPRLGRFVLLRRLGAGGMGTVFAAYDEQLDRKVALKLLHPREAEADRSAQQQRVLREAQAMARISHPNVVHVYSVDQIDRQIFIAMEFIEGNTLAEWERLGRPWREVLRMYRQAGEGLLAAHQAGLVHRDFKPENVLVDKSGRARVVDFGLAQRHDRPVLEPGPVLAAPAQQVRLTETGTISGTPAYMSPEQFLCAPADSRSDQFSFCVALYEALYRRRPFAGESFAQVQAEVLAGRLLPPPPDTTVPVEIQRALARGLATDPAARFLTMAELLRALDVDAESHPSGARSARWRLSLAMLVPTAFLSGIGLFRSAHTRITLAQFTTIMAIVVAIFSVGGFALRRTLLANAFHRGLTRLALCGCTALLGIRTLALLMLLPIEKLYPIDLMAGAGMIGGLALQYLPRLGWLAMGFLVASCVALRWPEYAEPASSLCYTLLPLAFILSWSRIASSPLPESPPQAASQSPA
ncbi:MAG: serine/threonine-protein kinase [Polyangia bacterium]